MEHTYYLVHPINVPDADVGVPGVYGDKRHDPDVIALLFASYMRELGTGQSGRYDGAALADGQNEHMALVRRVRVCVGCSGAGTGKVVDL